MTEKESFLKKRACGLLLHISSLPSVYGTGDFGKQAYRFADFLKKAGQSFWQVLPLNPTTALKANSPYACPSAFAGNTLFISPELLHEDGLLKKEQMPCADSKYGKGNVFRYTGRTDYAGAAKIKKIIMGNAYNNFLSIKNKDIKEQYGHFCIINNNTWLDDYASFKAFREYFLKKISARSWTQWPQDIKSRNRKECMLLKKELENEIEKEKFSQFIFNRQWAALKNYANIKGVQIIGDMPIYVDFESSDVWSNPHIFKLDSNFAPLYVSGVPPDYFSKNGQLWNNPVYDWETLEKDGFKWWINRISCNLLLFDITRIDHFRGFAAYWQVPAGKKTAKEGSWAPGRPESFFNTVIDKLGRLPVIAENLGVITADVEALMEKYGFPGIKVLQFAFGRDYPESVHLPHNYDVNSVVYTGTHDNNTLSGWYKKDAKRIEKKNLSKYAGKKINLSNICNEVIKLAVSSRAALSIIPLQDILELDWRARMNYPSTVKNNWLWQATDKNMEDLVQKHAARLYWLAQKYNRL